MNKYRSFACSTIGADHIRRQICCQDAVGKYEDEIMSIAAVSDGHGSPQYFRSDIGARFAIEAAIECVKEFIISVDNSMGRISEQSDTLIEDLANLQQRDVLLRGLQKSILIKWHDLIEEHYHNNPFDEDKLLELPEKYQKRYKNGEFESAYGATLIIVAATEYYWIGLQMGDGQCLIVNHDLQILRPIPDDPNCHDEVTTSLCQKDAKDNFRYYYSNSIPYAIFVASDGIEDSYDNDEMLFSLYKGIVVVFGKSFENGVKEIEEYLPIITQKGKGDDTSLSGIIDMKNISVCAELFRKQIDIEKKKTELETVKSTLQQIAEDKEICKKRIEELSGEINRLNAEYARQKSEYDNAQDLLQHLEEDMADITSQKENLIIQIHENEKGIDDLVIKEEILKEEINSAESEYADSINALAKEVNATKTTLNKTSHRYRKYQASDILMGDEARMSAARKTKSKNKGEKEELSNKQTISDQKTKKRFWKKSV